MHTGLLSGVSNLSGTQIEPDQVTFSWSSPYTLEGVPILGYELSILIISNINGSVISNTHESVNDSSLHVNVSKPDSSEETCICVNISVNARNMVGDGETVFSIFYFKKGKISSK